VHGTQAAAAEVPEVDLRRHLQVLWRFRLVVIGGWLLGIAVAIMASFHVSTSGLTWRSSQTFTSSSTLFVTQAGFPWGRVTLPATAPGQAQGGGTADPNAGTGTETQAQKQRREFGAPERFSDLAVVYSYLARSEQVRALIKPQPTPDQIVITPVQNPASGAGLPLLQIEASAHDQKLSQQLDAAVISALRRYLEEEQAKSDIPADLRVRVQVLNPPSVGTVTEGRSYIGALVAFVLAIAGAIGLAYLLENLSPSVPARLDRDWMDSLAEDDGEVVDDGLDLEPEPAGAAPPPPAWPATPARRF
jgi:hypothetical protein